MNPVKVGTFIGRAALAVVALTSLTFHPARGEVVANFSGGLGEMAPNEFPGFAGEGWADSWQKSLKGRIYEFSFDVEKDDGFKDGSEVLRVSRLEGNWFVTLSRTLDDNSLDPSETHVIQFQVRLDEFAGERFLFSIGRIGERKRSTRTGQLRLVPSGVRSEFQLGDLPQLGRG